MFDELRLRVCEANLELHRRGLVTLTWGNVSQISDDRTCFAIKPSGVPYESMTPQQMVVVALDGSVREGQLKPSSDTATHLHLYRHFPHIGGIVHTHSFYATIFAQARLPIPCLGTTHADHFCGPVPVTRPLTQAEVHGDYELNTGKVIVERFTDLDARAIPAVLVAGHAPFIWGKHAHDAVHNAVALEAVALMASGTLQLRPDAAGIEDYLLDKHFQRKHGPKASYGQAGC